MSDLISRKALIAEYDRVHIGPPGGARKLMEDAPAVDAVEVVRCKNCEYHINCICAYFWAYTRSDDFCSYGERRSDETD